MDRCCCGAPEPTPKHVRECRRRGAYHLSGHVVAACVVDPTTAPSGPPPVQGFTIAPGAYAEARLPIVEGTLSSPWQEVLVRLAGHAAEDIALGEQLSHQCASGEDWRLAERLLRSVDLYEHARDAFAIVKELLTHHRALLDAVAEALLQRGTLSPTQVGAILRACRKPDPGPP